MMTSEEKSDDQRGEEKTRNGYLYQCSRKQ